MIRRVAMVCVVMAGVLSVPANLSAQLDSKAVQVTKPEDIKWVRNAAGTQETGHPVRRSHQGRPVRGAAALAARQHEPAAHAPQRPVHPGDLGHLVARVRAELRAGEDRAA